VIHNTVTATELLEHTVTELQPPRTFTLQATLTSTEYLQPTATATELVRVTVTETDVTRLTVTAYPKPSTVQQTQTLIAVQRPVYQRPVYQRPAYQGPSQTLIAVPRPALTKPANTLIAIRPQPAVATAVTTSQSQENTGLMCKDSSNFPDTDDCQHFFVCVEGQEAYRYDCGTGLAYSRQFGICDYKHNVDCDSTQAVTPVKQVKPVKTAAVDAGFYGLRNFVYTLPASYNFIGRPQPLGNHFIQQPVRHIGGATKVVKHDV